MKILVTGGAGYIGSHVVRKLIDENYNCVVIDNLSTGFRWAVDNRAQFIHADIADKKNVLNILIEHKPDALMHFAASVVVPESVSNPLLYYQNNSANTLALIQACMQTDITKMLFSSTAAVYGLGRSDYKPLTENDALAPITPYGSSKMMSERFLADLSLTDAMRYVSLRYFNVAGAHPDGSIGQATANATHLIKIACETALNKRKQIDIYGTNYPTADGTCIRDYIHVEDLSQAHLLALEYLIDGGKSDIFNCGYGHGTSVRDIIDITKSVSGNDFTVIEANRRAGDPPELIANSDKIRSQLQWVPKYDNLETIIGHALQWEKNIK